MYYRRRSNRRHKRKFYRQNNKNYYTQGGQKIRNSQAYAKTGAPMYTTKYRDSRNINARTHIYKMDLENGKKYIGKTTNFKRRMKQHYSGKGAKVTQKFKPVKSTIVDTVPGFLADRAEQNCTDACIDKYGYNNVRGGKYCNSKTLHKTIDPGSSDSSDDNDHSQSGDRNDFKDDSNYSDYDYSD